MMKLPVQLLPLVFCLFATVSAQGYDDGYEQPPSKMKFNIGFNLPSMSIDLPKLELPQISIKASVKNKKPLTLKLPVIKFNGYANSDEDNSYGGGHEGGYGGGNQGNSGYGSSSGPSVYASGSGASGYVQAAPSDSYNGPSNHAGPSNGYERPSYGNADAGNSYASNEPAYASSGYSSQSAPSNYQPAKPSPVQYQYQPQSQYNNEPSGYQIHQNSYQPQQHAAYQAASSPSPSNGYFRPSQQVPSYREEPKPQSAPVQLYHQPTNSYQGGNGYESLAEQQPALTSYSPSSSPAGHQVGYGSFKRRSNHLADAYQTFGQYETSPEGRFVMAPVGDQSYKWQPILLRV